MRRVLMALVGGAAVVAVTAAPAMASTFSITGTMEGSLHIAPGDRLWGGYHFTISGSHPAATVGFGDARVTIPVSCTSGGPQAGVITINLAGGPYADPQNSSAWLPANDEHDPATWQGSTTAPDLCNGGTMFNASNSPSTGGGATFTADLQSTQSNKVNFQFHYHDSGATDCSAGSVCGASWSATPSIEPTVSATPVPVGAAGAVGVAAVLGGAAAVAQRRTRRRRGRVPA